MQTQQIEDEPGVQLKTDTTYKPELERREEQIFDLRDLVDYLELLQHEFDGHVQLLSISLRRQELQLQERLAERDLMHRGDRRRLKEQIIKGSQHISIKPKKTEANHKQFKDEAVTFLRQSTTEKLKEFAKKLQKAKMRSRKSILRAESDGEDDEEEIIMLDEDDIDSNFKKINETSLNNVYNKKKEEINKIVDGFTREIETCKSKNLPLRLIEKLKEKEMKIITAISDKFSKQLNS